MYFLHIIRELLMTRMENMGQTVKEINIVPLVLTELILWH